MAGGSLERGKVKEMLPSSCRMTFLLTTGSNSCMVDGKVIEWSRDPPANCPREDVSQGQKVELRRTGLNGGPLPCPPIIGMTADLSLRGTWPGVCEWGLGLCWSLSGGNWGIMLSLRATRKLRMEVDPNDQSAGASLAGGDPWSLATPAHMIIREEVLVSPALRGYAWMCPWVWEGMALAAEDTQGPWGFLQCLQSGGRVQAHTSHSPACSHSLRTEAAGPKENLHKMWAPNW